MVGLLMAVSGCIIVPGRTQEIRQPELSGRLVTSRGPLENEALFYSWIDERTPCSRIAGATTTDAQGRFRFDARETYSKPFIVTLAPSTPVYFLHICHTDVTGLSPIYSQAFAGYPPGNLHVECNLSGDFAGGWSCRAKTDGTDP